MVSERYVVEYSHPGWWVYDTEEDKYSISSFHKCSVQQVADAFNQLAAKDATIDRVSALVSELIKAPQWDTENQFGAANPDYRSAFVKIHERQWKRFVEKVNAALDGVRGEVK